MRVILNSDVLHSNRPTSAGLPSHIETFCRDAAAAGAILVLPRTSLLEDQRHQNRLAEEATASITEAAELLRRYGVSVPEIDAAALVQRGDLASALKSTGIKVELEDPSLADYRGAEQRACMRLTPHPPDTKSDEMRDLVIWEVAVRIAKRDGGAILVSRDEVHSHDRGTVEAQEAKLFRAKNYDEALALLGQESPAGALARRVLEAVWTPLRNAGVPLPPTVVLSTLGQVEFLADADGRASGSVHFTTRHDAGITAATALVQQASTNTVRVELRDVLINGEPRETAQMSIETPGELPRIARPQSERLEDLKELLGERE